MRFPSALRGTCHLGRTNALFLAVAGGDEHYSAAAARLGIEVVRADAPSDDRRDRFSPLRSSRGNRTIRARRRDRCRAGSSQPDWLRRSGPGGP